MEQPGFWAVLPANIRYDKTLTANEKILYSEITAMTQSVGYCYATNKYFAALYGVAKNTIRRYIQHLKEQGYIQVVMEGSERRIYQVLAAPDLPNDTPPKNERGAHPVSGAPKNERVPAQKWAGNPPKNERKNNTRDNNINNNTGARARGRAGAKEIDLESRFKSPDVVDAFRDYVEFRQHGRHPMTDRAVELACSTLERLASTVPAEHRDAYMIDILHQSIERGWEGLFKVDDWTPPSTVRRGSGCDRPREIPAGASIEDLF